VLRESDQSYYLREERLGWILGPYEKGAPARFADGVPDWFGRSLFPGDLDRLLPHVEAAMRRVPSLESCGIKDIVNGPISYTPDGSPLIGPPGICPTCGSTKVTASVSRPPADPAGSSPNGWWKASPASTCSRLIPRRYGDYTSKRYVVTKNEETYRNVFVIHFPDEERADARPAKTSPVYDKIDRMGAVWGQRYGWERAQLVRAARCGTQGPVEFPPLHTTSSTWVNECRLNARARRRDRPVPFHQARSDRSWRRGVARRTRGPTRCLRRSAGLRCATR